MELSATPLALLGRLIFCIMTLGCPAIYDIGHAFDSGSVPDKHEIAVASELASASLVIFSPVPRVC